MKQGLFITLEGIDGAGKSTHAQALAEALQAAGHALVRTREPGGTPLAERLRGLALEQGQEMDGMTEALLMFAARRDHVRAVIAPALAQGRTVLCDRFTDATFAYQGGGRGVSWQALAQLEQIALGHDLIHGQMNNGASHKANNERGAEPADCGQAPRPDLTLWFDLPPPQAARRLQGARLPDRFEAQPLAFFEAVRSAYARRMAEDACRFVRIDAAQPAPAVRRAALAALQERGWIGPAG